MTTVWPAFAGRYQKENRLAESGNCDLLVYFTKCGKILSNCYNKTLKTMKKVNGVL